MSHAALRRLVVAALFIVSAPAVAAAQRTFVSSSGSDANACTLSAPCRSFASAIAQTSANGEVIVQDSGGYGPVTLTTSVSIIAPAGVYGGITVSSGAGITIDGSNIKVVLRGLTINGQGGAVGIDFHQGARLTIEDVEIANMSSDGIRAVAPGSTVAIMSTVTRDNGGVGVSVAAGASVTISNSVLANNGTRGVFASAGGGVVTDVMVTRSTITGSNYGIEVASDLGGTTRVISDANVINKVVFAAFCFGGGGGAQTIYTADNNTVGFGSGVASGGSLTSIGTH